MNLRKYIRKSKKYLKTDRLRLSVFKSNSNIYAQIIDDTQGKTLVSSSSLKFDIGSNKDAAAQVGKSLAELAKKNNISKVWFDRGRYVYKGRVKALADSARENGLEF